MNVDFKELDVLHITYVFINYCPFLSCMISCNSSHRWLSSCRSNQIVKLVKGMLCYA